jgi:hypothetical protein
VLFVARDDRVDSVESRAGQYYDIEHADTHLHGIVDAKQS